MSADQQVLRLADRVNSAEFRAHDDVVKYQLPFTRPEIHDTSIAFRKRVTATFNRLFTKQQ